MPQSEKTKLAIFDNCEIFRTGLQCILSKVHDFEIISCFDFKAGEIHALSETPDVILTHTTVCDIQYQIEILRELRKFAPLAKSLLISEFSDVDYLAKILLSGCDGYVLRDVSKNALVRAIRNVNRELFVFDRNVVGQFLQFHKRTGHSDMLSPRETRIIELISEGLTSRSIASELGLATGTVKNMISVLLLRFGFQKRTQLVTLMHEANQISSQTKEPQG